VRGTRVNAFVKEERKKKTLLERLDALFDGCDAAIALPGGPGTLTEISLMWNLMIIQSLPKKPLILIGQGWDFIFDNYFIEFESYIIPENRDLLYFAEDVREAVKTLES